VEGRSFFARIRGSANAERKSWGRNASDSKCIVEVPGAEELRYKSVL